jgi:hypothetical protein
MAVSAAAMSEPSSIWPVVSTVTWTTSGARRPARRIPSKAPVTAALICRRSWHVSTISTSAPPSSRPNAWSP